MSTPRREPAELVALRAEWLRLATVKDVLADMGGAAAESAERKGHRDSGAENAKREHSNTYFKPAVAEYFAASDAYFEQRYDRDFVYRCMSKRDEIFTDDREMRALIVKARADLAARRVAQQPVERDRRRSR